MLEARYLNVDLVVESSSDLTPLIHFLEDKVFFLWKEVNGQPKSIGFESNLHESDNAEEDINELVSILENLPQDLRNVWDTCSKKVMDIGYECGAMQDPLNSLISETSITKISQLGFALNIRIYPCAEEPTEL